jgi:hypothetical protein
MFSLLLSCLDLLLCWKAMAPTGYALAQPPNRKLRVIPPFRLLPAATGRSNTVKQTSNPNRGVRTTHTVPGAAMAQRSIPGITDCWGVAVEPTSVAVRRNPCLANPLSR